MRLSEEDDIFWGPKRSKKMTRVQMGNFTEEMNVDMGFKV